MKPKKNVFSYFVIILYLLGILYVLVCGVTSLGEGREYPYLLKGTFLTLLLVIWLTLNGAAAILARTQLEDWIHRKKRLFNVLEAVVVTAVLCVAFYMRWTYIQRMPMKPESDYKTYYEIADLLKRGMLVEAGEGYCNYIAMFPHVFGYSYVLSGIFRLFGTSVFAAQGFNVFLAVGTVFLTYRTARLAGGVQAGLCALLLSAFWPSQILYMNMVASEYLFSFLMMLCVYLFIVSLKKCGADMKHPTLGVLLHVLLGILLALCASVRPMALIVLITIVLCIGFQRMHIPPREPIDQPISLVVLSKGWMRCAIIIICYLCVSSLCSAGIEYTIERPLASGSSSFGYNLLVGLNVESEGGWNQEDADYLYAALDRTGNATQAHLACRDLAIQRLKGDPRSILNLFLHKYEVLWGNDDFGSTWNILFMDQQGTLTKQRQDFLYSSRDVGNLYYLIVMAFAGIGGLFLWKKGMDYEYPFTLIFLGTVAMHLLVENQNRYHYHALFMIAIMAGCALQGIYAMNRAKVLRIREEKERLERMILEDTERLRRRMEDEKEREALREEAMKCQFDMKDALEKGLIKVSVSEAYEKE